MFCGHSELAQSVYLPRELGRLVQFYLPREIGTARHPSQLLPRTIITNQKSLSSILRHLRILHYFILSHKPTAGSPPARDSTIFRKQTPLKEEVVATSEDRPPHFHVTDKILGLIIPVWINRNIVLCVSNVGSSR